MIMEEAGSGYAIYQDLRSKGDPWPIMIKPVVSKEERFNGCLGEVEAGHFLLPADAPWLREFQHELKAFPQGKHDDQVDSFSQFVRYQMLNWRYVLTERNEEGRVICRERREKRPW